MMTFEQVLQRMGVTTEQLRLISHNSSNLVYLTDNQVLKIFTATPSVHPAITESALLDHLADTVPMAAILDYGQTMVQGRPAAYIVYEKLSGDVLDVAWPQADRASLCRQLGTFLSTIHATMPTAVSVDVPSVAPIVIQTIWATLDSVDGLATEVIRSVRQYVEQAWPATINAPQALCHGSFRFGNMLAQDNRITGLLDWEAACWADPLEELSLTLYRTVPDSLHDTFLSHYGAFDQTRLARVRLLYPLLYYLRFWPEIPSWSAFPGKQKYYRTETTRIIQDIHHAQTALHHK